MSTSQFVTAFGEEEARLWKHYPNEPKYLGDKSVWYSGQVFHLFPGAAGPRLPDRLHTTGHGDAAPYWQPRSEMHAHMREVVAAPENLRRLVLPTPQNGKRPNPNFGSFPVKYGSLEPRLAEYEIDDTIRIRSLTADLIEIERATYLDQLATNIWPDKPLPGRSEPHTLRSSDIVDGRLAELRADSVFANTLGSALVLIDKLGIPLLRFRGRPNELVNPQDGHRMAVMERGWHCVASGVTTWQDLDWSVHPTSLDMRWLIDGAQRGMWRELKEETGLTPEDGITMRPLAFAREIKRAGKPNLIFLAEARGKTCADLQRTIESRNPPDKTEYTEGTWKERFRLFNPKTWTVVLVENKPVAFLEVKEHHLGYINAHGFEKGTTGFTYENYFALRVAARWWSTLSKN